MKTTTLTTTLALLPGLLLAGCNDGGGSSDRDFTDAAVIATRASDYGSGAVSLVSADAPYTAINDLPPNDSSDLFVRSGGDHYFVMQRFRSNRIQRFEAATPSTATWSYSTEATAGEQSNPSDLLIASDTRAYLLRYGSGRLWIVNPSAPTEAAFHTGDIDLSSYDSFDGVPEMTAGLLRDGKLYVVLQRLENFDATKNGQVLVIDTATNAVTATIDLPVRNPAGIVAAGSNQLLVVATGGYDANFDPAYDGGIVRIDTRTNLATLALDDGDATTHPYGQLLDIADVDDGRAYLVGSTGFGADQTLYRFDPRAAPLAPVAVSGFAALALGGLAVDPSGNLWIGRTGDDAPGVSILGFASGAETLVKDYVDTNLIPVNVDFVTLPKT